MRVLFTGASSFTGCWFIHQLTGAGHKVVAALPRALSGYEGLKRRRVEWLGNRCDWVDNAPFGGPEFIRAITDGPGFDLLCHHGAMVGDFRSPNFDALAAVAVNSREVGRVLEVFRQRGGKAVLLTGSVFEPDEGGGTPPRGAVLPYGLSKGLTWQVFRYYAEAAGVPLGKFVIPNPFGPYEEPRFTAYLMRTWREGKIAEVRTPDYVRDNIHVDLLGQAYRACAERLVAGSAKVMRFNPSGYAGSQGAFAQRYAQEMRARLGWACELALARQTDFAEPLERVNTEPATQWAPNWDEGKAWDGVAEYYRNGVA